MHWSFKTGYHEIAAKKFLATGAPFPDCKSWKRFHAPGSVEGWILVEADNANACYEHAAEWAECLNWEVTPVLTDEEAGPLMAKAYNWSAIRQNNANITKPTHNVGFADLWTTDWQLIVSKIVAKQEDKIYPLSFSQKKILAI